MVHGFMSYDLLPACSWDYVLFGSLSSFIISSVFSHCFIILFDGLCHSLVFKPGCFPCFLVFWSMLCWFMYLFYVLKLRRRYLEECGKPNIWWWPLTSIVFFSILRKLMATVNCLVTNILPNIFFCAQQTKEIYRFETTWGRRSDKSYIFGLIIRLNS